MRSFLIIGLFCLVFLVILEHEKVVHPGWRLYFAVLCGIAGGQTASDFNRRAREGGDDGPPEAGLHDGPSGTAGC